MKSPAEWTSADGLVSRSLLAPPQDGSTDAEVGAVPASACSIGSQCRVLIRVEQCRKGLDFTDPAVTVWLAGTRPSSGSDQVDTPLGKVTDDGELAECIKDTVEDVEKSTLDAGAVRDAEESASGAGKLLSKSKELASDDSGDVKVTNANQLTATFSECSVNVVTGGADTEIDRLLEHCLLTLHSGDRCRARLVLRTDHLPGVWSPDRVWSADELVCSLTLVSVSGGQHPETMSGDDILASAETARLHGNRLFTAGRVVDAYHQYRAALSLLVYLPPMDETDPQQQRAVEGRIACRSNLSACQLRRGRAEAARAAAARVLQQRPDHVRCLYRRGAANLLLQELTAAEHDLQRVLQLQPENEAAAEKLKALRRKQKQVDQHTAHYMNKYFSQ